MRVVKNSKDNAIIKLVLTVTDPIALPTAISVQLLLAAISDTIISGKVVARETMVAPMIICGMPKMLAMVVAACTKKSPPLTIIKMPMSSAMEAKKSSK